MLQQYDPTMTSVHMVATICSNNDLDSHCCNCFLTVCWRMQHTDIEGYIKCSLFTLRCKECQIICSRNWAMNIIILNLCGYSYQSYFFIRNSIESIDKCFNLCVSSSFCLVYATDTIYKPGNKFFLSDFCIVCSFSNLPRNNL